jgi:peptidoglycan/LPS O-acetylase OafA/YrhL
MPDHATYLATRTFACLDGVRALAILAVVWHHAVPNAGGWTALERGFLGVDLFFVVSGFLIVTLLLRERARRRAVDLRAFYMRRLLRIVPLNYAVIGAVWALATASGGAQSAAIGHDAVAALLYTTNWVATSTMLAITWSLAAEEQFYVVWPLVERWLPGKAIACWAALTAASVALAVGHVHFGLWPSLPGMLWQTTFFPILLGVGLAHALHAPRGFAVLAAILGHRAAAPACLALLAAATSLPGDDISGAPRLLLQVLFGALVAACVLREDNGLRPALTLRPVARIGVVSYGIYLLHQLAIHAAEPIGARLGGLPSAGRFALALALSWLLAETSFRTFERWFLRRKDAWAR